MEERQAQISIELRKRFPEGTADAGLMEEAVQELIALRSEYEELQRKLLFWHSNPPIVGRHHNASGISAIFADLWNHCAPA